MAVTAFLASFLDHLGRRAGQYLWPDPEEKEEEEEDPKKDSSDKKDPKKEPEKEKKP